MAKVLISEKYLHDIANAIRVKLDSQSTYTPAQMAAAIADITGTISGTITPSTDTDKVLVTDSNLTAIANAIRAKLDVATTYTPSQMADAILSIQSAGPTMVSWSTGTDEEVAAMIDAAHAETIDLQQDGGWAVGDVRTITVGAFTAGGDVSVPQQNIDVVITSFNDYNNCGCVMQFDFKDCLAQGIRMNASDTNRGGFTGSEMFTVTIPSLIEALPSWISQRLIQFSITDSGSTANGKLALRSYGEVRINSGDPNALPYYDQTTRIKNQGHNGSAYTWWVRNTYGNNMFCNVISSGTNGYSRASLERCLAPFGCL